MLITDARLGSAVAAIRSLGRRGIDVIAADSSPLSPGFFSRYAADRLRYPEPASAPEEFVAVLLSVVRKRHVDLILPVTDETILPLAAARREFEAVTKLALPDDRALAIAQDKAATFELAERLRIPTPRTTVVTSAEEGEVVARDFGWPVVLKPQTSRLIRNRVEIEAFNVVYATNVRQLRAHLSRFEGRSRVLIQEFCGGEGRGVGLLMSDGDTLAAFHYRRLREVPITGGPSSFRESIPLDSFDYDYAKRLLGALNWSGLAMVEFKGTPAAPRLMEINGRIWGSLPLAVASGVDFPLQAVNLHLHGRKAVEPQHYKSGVRSRDLRLEVAWIASTLRSKVTPPLIAVGGRRPAFRVAGRLFLPRDGYDILSREDPLPGIAEMIDLLPRLYKKWRRRVARGR